MRITYRFFYFYCYQVRFLLVFYCGSHCACETKWSCCTYEDMKNCVNISKPFYDAFMICSILENFEYDIILYKVLHVICDIFVFTVSIFIFVMKDFSHIWYLGIISHFPINHTFLAKSILYFFQIIEHDMI